MASNIQDKQQTKLTAQQFLRRVKSLDKLVLKTGIPKESTRKDEENKGDFSKYIANIAFVLNYGSYSGNISPRPFGSTTIPRYWPKIKEIIKREIFLVLSGKQSAKKAYNRIGIMTKSYMQHNLRFGGWKANEPITIKMKGSSQPLIDKGQLRQSITYVVAEKDT